MAAPRPRIQPTGSPAEQLRTLALWLTAKRKTLESALAIELGSDSGDDLRPNGAPRTLDPGAAEFEALRRFRSFCLGSLRGEAGPPALDGLRVAPLDAAHWIDGWVRVACREAGAGSDWVAETLSPLATRFQSALRATQPARSAGGQPQRSKRRLVTAAIDRISDAFVAVDVESGEIVDSNPAAAALLGVERAELLGSPVASWIASHHHGALAVELDSLTEGGDVRAARLELSDRKGRGLPVELRITRHVARGRVLALLVARAPLLGSR